jgi:ATP-binding cassette subfamily B protein
VKELPVEKNAEKSPIGLLWELSGGSRGMYLIACASMILSIACNFLMPQLIRFFVDSVGGVSESRMPVISAIARFAGIEPDFGERRAFARAGLAIVAVAALGGIFSLIHRRALSVGAEGLIKRLRDRLYSHIQRLPFRWHVTVQTGDIVQRCTSDVDIVRGFVFIQMIEMARAAALVVFAYTMLFRMNFSLAAASFVYLPVMFFYSYVFLRKASARFLAADEAEGQLLATVRENCSGVRVVRAFGRERHEAAKFAAQNELFVSIWIKLGNMLSAFWGAGDLLTGLQMITICAAGTYQAAKGGVTVGEFMVFLSYNGMTVWPVRGLGRVLSDAGKTMVSLVRLREILETPPETDPPGAIDSPISGDIEFDGVSFAYDGARVLKNVSFTVREGTSLGVLGATGSGKTTAAHLLCGLYDLADGDGTIRIGGVDIKKYKRRHLRENVGIVLQEPFLYSGTIAENIAGLSKDYPIGRIREAAAVARVDSDIERFARGYDTIVGERGVTLSGGQRQRVAIARAALRDTPIMIFDDSLSAVDTETDARIRAALRERVRGVTAIMISHRVATISDADLIMVMEGGRVAEMGTPSELMELGGIYRRVTDAQRAALDDIAEDTP